MPAAHVETPRYADAFRPPCYTNWDQVLADVSLGGLADLAPLVLATGHGVPIAGHAATRELQKLVEQAVAHELRVLA